MTRLADDYVAAITERAMRGELDFAGALDARVAGAQKEPDLRCLVITGAGEKAFIAGAVSWRNAPGIAEVKR